MKLLANGWNLDLLGRGDEDRIAVMTNAARQIVISQRLLEL